MITGKFNIMVEDTRCKQNSIRAIDRKTCKNNCKYWRGYCLLGYNNKK